MPACYILVLHRGRVVLYHGTFWRFSRCVVMVHLSGCGCRALASTHRFCMDRVRQFIFSCSRRSVSGTEGCSSFVRTGSTIWRNSRPRPGARLPAESLLVVLDTEDKSRMGGSYFMV